VLLLAYMRGMAVAVADQVIITGAGESMTMMRHVGDVNFAPSQFKHCLFAVIGKYSRIAGHHPVQRGDVAQIVAVNGMDGQAKLKRGAQGIGANQVAAMNDDLRTGCAGTGNRRCQCIGAVMTIGNDADFHTLLAL